MAALDGLTIAGRGTRHQPAARPPRPGRGSMDWDDVRVFLAVAREGSMRAAGRALGLSQPTIARRLAAFEASFGGASLFDRFPSSIASWIACSLYSCSHWPDQRPLRRSRSPLVKERQDHLAAGGPARSGGRHYLVCARGNA